MLESMNTSSLEYEKLSEEEMNRRGILGRLVGPIADTVNATRNNRKYSDELWEAVFNNPIMKEKFDRGGVFGECGHPQDRTEVDMEKIALCMPKPPKKDRTGKLQAVFDILATPCGKILKTLCDYGYKIGISSRGSGDTYIDNDGNESVDPKTYDCECFDAVLIPAVKAATLKLVTESVDNKVSFKKALAESLKSAKDDNDRKIMKEALDELNINYQENVNEDIKINTPVSAASSGNNTQVTDDSIDLDNIDEVEDEENNSSSEGKDIVNQNNMEAKNSGSDIVEDLQEALRKNRELEKQILELQEKLSVCYAKEAKSDEAIQKYRSSIKSLSESLKKATSINQKASILENQLDEKNKEIEQKQKLIEDLESKNKNSIIRKRQEVSSLNESLIDKDKEIENLTKRVKTLNENLSSIKGESEKEINNLKEQLGEAKKDALITAKNYSNKIAKSNEIVEQYKKTAQKAVNKYIDLQASFLGITANEIKNRLPKSYSFNDIDSICENLQEYRVNISKLPFAVDSLNEDFGSSKIRMQAEESKDSLLEHSQDDSVDNELLGMVDRFIKK